MTRLEHANITVPSIDAAIEFFEIAAPDFEVRADQQREGHYRWAHVGNEENYIALQEPQIDIPAKDTRNPYHDIGINHIALTVTNIDDMTERLKQAGFEINGGITEEPYRKRVYFWDKAHFEWELVEYFTEDKKLRYIYE